MQSGTLECGCMSLVFGKVVSGHASHHSLFSLRAWCQRSSFRELLMSLFGLDHLLLNSSSFNAPAHLPAPTASAGEDGRPWKEEEFQKGQSKEGAGACYSPMLEPAGIAEVKTRR